MKCSLDRVSGASPIIQLHRNLIYKLLFATVKIVARRMTCSAIRDAVRTIRAKVGGTKDQCGPYPITSAHLSAILFILETPSTLNAIVY